MKRVRPALAGSYEALCHDAGGAQWLLPLRAPLRSDIVDRLSKPLLERAIGVIYRPETELQSHYFEAVLPAQFDEYIWFDVSGAVAPLAPRAIHGLPDTYPFRRLRRPTIRKFKTSDDRSDDDDKALALPPRGSREGLRGP